MDKYAIMCIFALILQSFWHAIIGIMIFLDTPDNRLTPYMWYTKLDHYIFFGVITIFIIVHLILVIWLHLVPLKHRKNMLEKDIQYHLSMTNKKKYQSNKGVKKSVSFSRILISTEA